MTMIYGLLVRADGSFKFCKVKDALDTYYDILNCDTIDIARRDIGGEVFDIVCDDEALCKGIPPNPTIFEENGNPMIFGNVFICRHNGPEMASISKEDEELLSKYLFLGILAANGEPVDETLHWCIKGAKYPPCPWD